MNNLKRCLLAVLSYGALSTAMAAPLDLSSWSANTLDLSGGQTAGNWVLSAGNTTVTQTVNADPSFYLNNLNQTSYTMQGNWRVVTTGDDDFIGFAFGYQGANQTYVFDWKQNYQNAGTGYGIAQEGLTVRKIDAPNVAALTLEDFWSSTGTANSTILATSYGSDKGWADNTLYEFLLDFRSANSDISITVKQGATTLWQTTITDSSYAAGQFGFYNFSQEQVEYSGFTQEGGVIVDGEVPAPAALALLGIGLLGLGHQGRRKARRG